MLMPESNMLVASGAQLCLRICTVFLLFSLSLSFSPLTSGTWDLSVVLRHYNVSDASFFQCAAAWRGMVVWPE
ncbi:hypothetical protein BKA81DRAFT_374631 [Phyllosticta paracitricarpa]